MMQRVDNLVSICSARESITVSPLQLSDSEDYWTEATQFGFTKARSPTDNVIDKTALEQVQKTINNDGL